MYNIVSIKTNAELERLVSKPIGAEIDWKQGILTTADNQSYCIFEAYATLLTFEKNTERYGLFIWTYLLKNKKISEKKIFWIGKDTLSPEEYYKLLDAVGNYYCNKNYYKYKREPMTATL